MAAALMSAAVLRGPRDLAVLKVPRPEPPPGLALLQVAACGICGSDLRYYDGENPWAKHTLGWEKPNPPNMILGHEVAGFWEGVAVAALAFKGCGRCLDCRRGREQLCAHTAHLGHGAGWDGWEYNPGGMAELCLVWEENLFALPSGVSCAEATLLDGLGVAVHAVRRADIVPAGAFAVLGAGPIGLCVMQVAKALGAGRAHLIDVYDAALECGSVLGAEHATNVSNQSPEQIGAVLLEATGGKGFDAIFESTGDHQMQQMALRCLARGGCLMLMAGVAPSLTLADGCLAGERRITTSANNLYEEFQIGLELLASGRVRVGEMITHRFPLQEVGRAFQVALHKAEHGALKVVVEP